MVDNELVAYMVREPAGDDGVPGQLTHITARQLPHLNHNINANTPKENRLPF